MSLLKLKSKAHYFVNLFFYFIIFFFGFIVGKLENFTNFKELLFEFIESRY